MYIKVNLKCYKLLIFYVNTVCHFSRNNFEGASRSLSPTTADGLLRRPGARGPAPSGAAPNPPPPPVPTNHKLPSTITVSRQRDKK